MTRVSNEMMTDLVVRLGGGETIGREEDGELGEKIRDAPRMGTETRAS